MDKMPKPWWPGDSRVEPYMDGVREALNKHYEYTQYASQNFYSAIYNSAYMAVYKAIRDYTNPLFNRKEN